MTDNELKKLNRTELLELLVEQSKRIDELQSRLDEAEAKLADSAGQGRLHSGGLPAS